MDSVGECIAFCKDKFGEDARFFSYNKVASEKKKFSKACRCKKTDDGRREKKGVVSGNLWCDHGEFNFNNNHL